MEKEETWKKFSFSFPISTSASHSRDIEPTHEADSEHLDPFFIILLPLHLSTSTLHGLDRRYHNGVKLEKYSSPSAAHLRNNSYRRRKAIRGYQYDKQHIQRLVFSLSKY